MSVRSQVRVSLEAGDIGWVRFGVRVGDAEFVHDISDLTDALGDLVRAALHIACGGVVAECAFDLEPGDLTLRLERGRLDLLTPDALRITIAKGSGLGAQVELFSAECASETLGEAVRLLADDLFNKGTDTFHDRWDRQFPKRARAALHAALLTPGI